MPGSTPGSGSVLPSSLVLPRWEWGLSEVWLRLLQYLIRQRKRPLVRYFDWYILLIANPDGYVETWEGDRSVLDRLIEEDQPLLSREWRKNKNPEDRLKCRQINIPAVGSGVDLNRWVLLIPLIKIVLNKTSGILDTNGKIKDGRLTVPVPKSTMVSLLSQKMRPERSGILCYQDRETSLCTSVSTLRERSWSSPGATLTNPITTRKISSSFYRSAGWKK